MSSKRKLILFFIVAFVFFSIIVINDGNHMFISRNREEIAVSLTFIIVLFFWSIFVYNKAQGFIQSVKEKLSNLDAALKKKDDLNKQVIDIASKYAIHEKATHESLSFNHTSMQNIFALAQAYPELKADSTYKLLMSQLNDIEQSILKYRVDYNSEVNRYNSYIKSFPTVIAAQQIFGYKNAPYFDIDVSGFSEKVKFFLD